MFVFYRIRIQNQHKKALNRAYFRKKFCTFVTPSPDVSWRLPNARQHPFSQPATNPTATAWIQWPAQAGNQRRALKLFRLRQLSGEQLFETIVQWASAAARSPNAAGDLKISIDWSTCGSD